MSYASSTLTTLCLTLCLTLFVGSVASLEAAQVTEKADVPAAGIDRLVLRAGNGSARIVTGAEEKILITVGVSPKRWTDEQPFRAIRGWFLTSRYDAIEDLLAAVRIETRSGADGELRVGLTPRGSARSDRVAEAWTVTVPERLAVEVDMSSAEVEIEGVSGGAKVSAGHGSVRIDVPEGDLRVALTVGDVEVVSGSRSLGDVDLRSAVGSARLRLNGARIKVPKAPGPGSSVSISGRGDDEVVVDVEVGDIKADLGEER